MDRTMGAGPLPDRWLARVTRESPLGPAGGGAIVAALLALVGFADFESGIRLSLGLFYLVPILLAVAWFGGRVGILVVLASMLLRVSGDLAFEDGANRARGLARGLLLSRIEPDRLAEKLAELAAEGRGRGIACEFVEHGLPLVRDAETAAQLYRIAQEALRNAIRHADAHRIVVSLSGDDRVVCLTVEDDGRGIGEEEPRSGMGVPIMAHRRCAAGRGMPTC